LGKIGLNLLNAYFDEQYKLNIPDNDLNLIERLINMDIFKGIREKYSDIIEPPLKNLDSIADMPLQENLPKVKKLINQNSRFKSFILDVVKICHENIVSMWKTFYYYDEILFNCFTNLMNLAKKVEKEALLAIIIDFQKRRHKGFSLYQKIQSLLDVSEVKTEARIKIKTDAFTLKDLDSKNWDVIERLNQKSMDEQQINLQNWCKELSNLIEDQFKRILYFIFLINHLIIEKESYNVNKSLKNLSIHNILKLFSERYDIYKNVDKLHHIRNSVSHANFKWDKTQPIARSNIIFKDREWIELISFEQIIHMYFKIITFISTFELVVMITQLCLSDDSKPFDKIMKELGNQIFKISLKQIRSWLEKQINNQ